MKKSMIRIPALLLCVCLLIGMVTVLPALFRGRFSRGQGVGMLTLYLGYLVLVIG
jgi:Ca2+/Na+ antiporter